MLSASSRTATATATATRRTISWSASHGHCRPMARRYIFAGEMSNQSWTSAARTARDIHTSLFSPLARVQKPFGPRLIFEGRSNVVSDGSGKAGMRSATTYDASGCEIDGEMPKLASAWGNVASAGFQTVSRPTYVGGPVPPALGAFGEWGRRH